MLWRVGLGIACVALVLAAVGVARGQRAGAPLRQSGGVVIWIVTSDPDARAKTQAAGIPWPPEYQEQTAGSFGQTAGGFGQTAGSYGQTAGSFGDTAGSNGQTAGNYGQTAGSYGATAGSVGQNAGDAGKTMDEFGVSTTDLPQAAARANAINRPAKYKRDVVWEKFEASIHAAFPQFWVKFVDVFDTELQAKLTAAAGTSDQPDLLAWKQVPGLKFRVDASWLGQQVVTNLWRPIRWPQTEEADSGRTDIFWPEVFLLSGARNPDSARALCAWLSDDGRRLNPGKMTPQGDAVGQVAASVVRSLLQGGSAGASADPEMAGRDARMGSAAGYALSPQVNLRTDVEFVHLGDHLAVAAVRAVGVGPQEFGVLHALVVLRKDSQDRWKVLQASLDLAPDLQGQASDLLVQASEGASIPRNEGTKPKGISQAAPPDGDRRSAEPELWWDNLGGATLQVVEWQTGAGPVTNLFFVPDIGSRLRTGVVARFARDQRQYRWRVWSVGPDGTIVVSPWRTLNIVEG